MTHISANYCIWESIRSRTFHEGLMLVASGSVQSIIISTGSLLPHTRNQSLVDLYNSKVPFTHVLFIDGDMLDVTPEVVKGLLDADKDLITPVMTRRVPPFSPAMSKEDLPLLFEQFKKPMAERGPIPVISTGFGVCLIKKHILDELMEKRGTNGVVWFTGDRFPRETFWDEVTDAEQKLLLRDFPDEPIEKIIQKVYREGVAMGFGSRKGGMLYGEDNEFCQRMREKGFQPWVHTGLYVSHIGDQSYNIKDYIDFCELQEKGDLVPRPELSRVSVWNIISNEKTELVHGDQA